MASARAPRSLADDLRARSAGQLRRLLSSRPDLLHPWPADVSELARRAADDASVLEAMQSLTTADLRVLEVFACVHEATAEQVGEPEIVEELWSRGLLWGGPTFRIVRAAQQAFGPYPCGLGPAGHTQPDPEAVRQAALDMDPDRLRYLIWESPVSTAANPLTITRGEQHIVPREVALILREGRYLPPDTPPEPLPQVDPAPAEGMWAPLAGVRYLLSELAKVPAPWNPARGVGRRALTERAVTMGVPYDDLVCWLELAAVAGLVGGADSEVRPTSAARAWLAAAPAQMWRLLIEPWLDSDRPLLRCRPDELGAVTTAGQARTALHRRNVLQAWPAGRITTEALRAHITWQRPRMADAAAQSPEFAAELERLGLLVGAIPTHALGLLPDGIDQVRLPEAAQQPLIVQPDLTVIAPLNLDSATWALLHDISRLESWGPVTMHRIDPALLRSAIGTRDPQQVLADLAAASRTPLPQSLEYLVRDAARVQPVRIWAASLVRATADDAPTLRDLGLQEIADGTFASEEPLDVLRERLQAAGVSVETSNAAQPGTPLEYPRSTSHDPAAVDRLVARLVGDEQVTEEPPPLRPVDPVTVAARCQQAVAQAQTLWLEFHDGGATLTHLVEPFELRAGMLSGWSLSAGRTITVPLSRIAALGDAA